MENGISSDSYDPMDYTENTDSNNTNNNIGDTTPVSSDFMFGPFGRDRKKAAIGGIQGQALDRVGLREQVDINGNFVKLMAVWARRLVDLGDSPMENFAPPLTFVRSSVMQRTSFQMITWSGKQYVHVPPDAYVFAQQPRDLLRESDLTSGLPVVPGLTVTVFRLVNKLDAPPTKSFFLGADAKSAKSERSKPFKLTRATEASKSFVPPADRLAELSNQLTATATILFPKQALNEGEFISQDSIRSQGGAMALIFRPERLAWIVFLDFSPLSAAFFQSSTRPESKVSPPPPGDIPSKPTPPPPSQQQEGSAHAFRGYSNIHSSSYQSWSSSSSFSASSFPSILSAGGAATTGADNVAIEKTRQALEEFKLGVFAPTNFLDHTKEKKKKKKKEEEDIGADDVSNKENGNAMFSSLLDFTLENASLAAELSKFLSFEHNAMWVNQATSAGMALVTGIYRRNLVSVMRHRTVPQQAATILWIATIVRMSTRTVMENIAKGLYHDMPLVNPQVRQFIWDHHTPRAMRLTATTLLNTSILLRWSNLERCKQLHDIDVQRGIPCFGEVLTRRDNSLGKYSSYAFSMNPVVALKVVRQKNPIMGTGWQETHARDIARFVDDMIAQIYIHLAGVQDDDYRVSRPFALLLRAKIYTWMSQQHHALSAADTLFGIHTVAYLNLVMTACAYELLILSGVPDNTTNTMIDASDHVDTEAAMIQLNENIRNLPVVSTSQTQATNKRDSNGSSPKAQRRQNNTRSASLSTSTHDSDAMDVVYG